MTIDHRAELEASLKAQADARGLSPDTYVREVLELGLQAAADSKPKLPFKSGSGVWTKYGISISDEDIAETVRTRSVDLVKSVTVVARITLVQGAAEDVDSVQNWPATHFVRSSLWTAGVERRRSSRP